MNLAELAEEALQRLGPRMTLNFDGEKLTNVQMMDRTRRMHRAFTELGLGRGDAVVLFMTNHPLVYSVFGGAFRAGATAVPVMFQLTAPELRYILSDTAAQGVVTDSTVLYKVREAVKGLDHIKWIAIRGGKDDPAATPPEFALEPLFERDPQTSLPPIEDHDVAVMLYTSGTTGKPKGVMLTHDNLYASAEASNAAAELERWEGPRIGMSAMPMAHIFGVGVMNSGYLIPERLADAWSYQMQWFQPEPFMKNIHEQRCTTMVAVPTMLSLILNHPNVAKYDLSCLQEVICGAAPLPVEVAKAFMDRYGCRLREIYGMTENVGMGSANRVSEPYRPGSAGRPYPGHDVRVVDDNDQPLPPGQRGEIVTRGRAVMKGYHNLPDATAETLRGGWLHSGDIGYFDEDGHLYIVDRKKDMIIRGGENIYPAELEDVLYAHPGIAEAAAVGVPDGAYGEGVVAFVVPRAQAQLTAEEIMAYMRERVTSFKAPQRVIFLEALPKVGVGKILRRELREKAKTA